MAESPCRGLAMAGCQLSGWVVAAGFEPTCTQVHCLSPALIGGIQAGRSEFVTNPQRFTNGSGSDLKGWRELSFPFHITRKKKGKGG